MIAGVIYQEQATNVNFADAMADYIGGLAHVNMSIGIGQVRVKTAEALERVYSQLNPTVAGEQVIQSNAVRVEFLKHPLMNIRYVAAKLKFDQERWKKAGFDISSKPEILGTLYHIEDVANPHIAPYAHPDSDEFGAGVKHNYAYVRDLLGI
ncbi:MAG: hypothetical protein A3H70_02125 [Candidatus Komeilibacteria bacterium RIFCSPLOWO2_02_FULL_48_11]|uniref:Uncharacterized protein n=1 Tax=Candidatus Komeilibacteria bacterium RIFCSPLOWO2_02_FULL_48_11 TaxID=1798553 RepID=A0A1G2BUG6_9BACT|nr:MAG: hypothetical protein A3H70_02125 [Candidatus Komeilibacteria bacterium RIFCSPLOWO2_02_FULL_48_11]